MSGVGRVHMTATESLYELFRIPPTCTDDELRKAFIDRIFVAHPDRNPDQTEEATRVTQNLTSAYTQLMDSRSARSNGIEEMSNNRETDFTINFNSVSLKDIRDRRSQFRIRWEGLQKDKSNPMRALFFIHAAFEAERFDSVTSLLQNQRLIDLASLLLTLVDPWRGCQTLIRWANLLWSAKQGREAVQILEDVVASGRTQVTEDAVSNALRDVIEELRSFHYRWAQYADPRTGVKATAEVRIVHLNRILSLGFRFGYIFNV
jgi:DnaJ domain